MQKKMMPFEKKGFCDSCLHRFGFGFFASGEHEASQPWTKLGYGEWMESLRAAGSCVTGIATKAELPGRSLHHRWDHGLYLI